MRKAWITAEEIEVERCRLIWDTFYRRTNWTGEWIRGMVIGERGGVAWATQEMVVAFVVWKNVLRLLTSVKSQNY